MRKLIRILLCAALLLALPFQALAAMIPEEDRIGSLTFRMEWEDQKLDSGSLTLYRVGQIIWKNGRYEFELVPELADTGASLKDLDDSALPKTFAKLAQERELDAITAPIEEGTAHFAQMQTGLYVVTQSQDQACDGLKPINPFLISLPRWDGSCYVYDLTADPKMAMETEPTEPTEPPPPPPTEPEDPNLPQTGQLNWPIPLMFVSGMILVTIGLILCFRKKEDRGT